MNVIPDGSVDNNSTNDDIPEKGAPTHIGFSEKDKHGAIRISYLDDPNLGFDFNGSQVVYSSRRGFMYLVDLESQKEQRIYPDAEVNEDTFLGVRANPVVHDKLIVSRGVDTQNNPVRLYLFNITSMKAELLDIPCNDPRYMDIDKDFLVWNDRRHWNESGGQNIEVYLYSLSDSKEARLTNQSFQQFFPRINGNSIVWEDYAKGRYREEIVLFNNQSKTREYLTDDSTRQFAPDIDGDNIVWTDLRNGTVQTNGNYENADIYLYKISTGELRQITSEVHDQEYPTISGHWIAWTDVRFGTRGTNFIPDTTNIYAFNLISGEEKQVTFGKGYHECCPKVYGDKLVYYSFSTGGWGSLWMVDLTKYWPD